MTQKPTSTFSKRQTRISLFTLGYPYHFSAENMFLNYELTWLREKGFEVTIYPLQIGGSQDSIESFTVDTSLAKLRSNVRGGFLEYFLSIFRVMFTKEGCSLFFKAKYSLLFGLIRYHISVLKESKTLRLWSGNLLYDTILYTFWATSFTEALVRTYSSTHQVLTRAHGIDLYLERSKVYNRRFLLKKLDAFIVPSNYAYEYMHDRFPKFGEKIHFCPIGVSIPSAVNEPLFVENFFRLVSCSTVDSNKRVLLIAKVIMELARNNAMFSFEWVHFGDGPLFEELKNLFEDYNCDGLTVRLMGAVSRETVLSFYENEAVSLFVSFSESEGGRPLSIQEALSYGIPICVTPNQGIRELYRDCLGLSVDNESTVSEISMNISHYLRTKAHGISIRRGIQDFARSNLSVDVQSSYLSKIFLQE